MSLVLLLVIFHLYMTTGYISTNKQQLCTNRINKPAQQCIKDVNKESTY